MPKTTRLSVLLLLLSLGPGPPAAAEFDFYASGSYRDGVPTPEEFLGYPLGSLLTHHFRMEAYFEALAAAAGDRVEIRRYGESYEKKRLFIAVVSAPENLERLEEVRRRNLELADPERTSLGRAEAIAAEAPVVVWLDYGNDGNETANLEAAMQAAYQLIAGEDEETRRLRREAVVIFEPDHNPESHDRHVAWYNAFGIGDPDPASLEHHAPWGMSTNNNHYQIDLNRDAWGLTQQETLALAAEVLEWRPQVFVDHHGQTENYFFAPPAAPINRSLPESHRRWYEVFGRGNARAFDRQGWQYYTRDVFDLFYPGYWDSWPSLHGAIGMTYETDGGGHRGLAWRRRDGSIVTFRDGIARHFAASIATVRTAVENRRALLLDFHAFFADALDEGRRGEPARAYLIDGERDPRRAAALVGLLMRHGVEVRRLSREITATGRSLVDGGGPVEIELPAGSYLVDMAQREKRVAETFIEPDPELDPEFVQRELARWSRNARRGEGGARERHEFYDLTSWSLPVAFGVEAWAVRELPAGASEPVVPIAERIAGDGGWTDEIPFESAATRGGVTARVTSPDGEPTAVDGPPAPAGSAYVFDGNTEGAARLAVGLLREGYRVAVSRAPLVVGAAGLPRGAFVLAVDRNPADLHQRITALATEAGVEVWAADTAFAAHGKTGVGSNPVTGLRRPRIAVLADEGVRITEYGAAWFTLERRLGYPFTPLRFRQLLRSDLDDFDVIVLPEGSPAAFRSHLGEEGIRQLAGWIERGGTLVAWGGGAAAFLIDAELVSASFVGTGEPAADGQAGLGARGKSERIDRLAPDGPRPPLPSPSADPGRPQAVPGVVARARLDLSHWLTLGYTESELPVLVRGDRFLALPERGDSPIVLARADRLRVGGFFWPGNTEEWLAGTAYAVVEPRARGQVILFAQDPNYRLVWRATSRLFTNALFLGPTLGRRMPRL